MRHLNQNITLLLGEMISMGQRLYDVLENTMPRIEGRHIYVWGMGHTGELYLKGLERIDRFKIYGFCDSKGGREKFGNYKVYDVESVANDSNAFVLICTWQKKALDEINKICDANHIEHMGLDMAIFKLYRDKIYENLQKMDDELSQLSYETMINNRMTNTLPESDICCHEHYFSIPAMRRYGQEVMVNCGAYVGDTLEQYIWETQSFKRIYAFEPERESFASMTKRVQRLKDEWNLSDDKIMLYNSGVGATTHTEYFIESKAMGSMFSQSDGGVETSVVALDDVIDEKVSVIIADIEGYEYDMLLGARRIITEDKPTCAICIYHNAVDFFSIQQLFMEMVPEYRFAVRHCSVTFDETVLFAYTPDAVGWVL